MIFTHDFSAIIGSLGPVDLRWYGLAYAVGISLNYAILMWIFKREKYSLEKLDSLVIWLFFGLLIGARLGHVFFYEASYYLAHPLQILMVWKGGLASHGGAIGLFLAYVLWCKFKKVKISKLVNAIVVPMPLTAAFVRFGNFMNSEIVGYPTNSDYGVIFKRLGEDFPRHPVQLYSVLMNLLVFAVIFTVYKKYDKKMPAGSLAMLYVLLYFVGRFVVEFWKDLQGPIPEGLGITTGQFLSVWPVAIALIYFGWLKFKRS